LELLLNVMGPEFGHIQLSARDGLKAVLSRQRQRSRQRRGKAAMSLTEPRQGRGRGRELEAEARQTKFEARPRRGDPLEKKPFPLMYSNGSAKFGRFKSNCMTEVNGLVVPPSWVEVIYVIPLYGVSLGLNLNLSSVGGRSLKLTDYYRAEARRYLPDRADAEAETMRQSRGRGSKVETEARPRQDRVRPRRGRAS